MEMICNDYLSKVNARTDLIMKSPKSQLKLPI